MKTYTAKDAQIIAYEKAAKCKQGSAAHSYWMGSAHAFGVAGGSIPEDFFILPPYIPADKPEPVK